MVFSRAKVIALSLVLAVFAVSTLLANTINFANINNADESFNITMHYQDGSSTTVLLSANFTTNVSSDQTVTGITVNSELVTVGTSKDVELSSLTMVNVDFTGVNSVIFSELEEEL